MNPKNLTIAAIAVIAIALGAWMSYRMTLPPPQPRVATILPAPAELPEFSLLDHNGQAIGRDVFKGQWDLVFFGFTHCPDICPTTLQALTSARRQLAEAGQDPLPRIVFVSVDPERDTPELMGQYLAYFGDGNLGITGELDEIRKLTDGVGIFFEKSVAEDGNYSVGHSAAVLVFNPRGEFQALFGSRHEVDDFVHDLPIIIGEN